jgi:hypothetical protein
MATYLDNTDYPDFGYAWRSPIDDEILYLRERSFPRNDRMVCLMENLDGVCEYFVFPY